MAVILLNREGDTGKSELHIVSAFADLPWQTVIPEACHVRDLWSHCDLGIFHNDFGAVVESRSVGAYVLTPA